MMTQYIKSILNKRLSPLIVFVFSVGLVATPNAHSQANQSSGIDDAKTSVTELRDPFWPVGFIPEGKVEKGKAKKKKTTGSVDWNKAMKQVSIQGVSSRAGNEFFTIINGQVKTAGETVSVKVFNILYTWEIDSIAPPSSVKLRRVSAQ